MPVATNDPIISVDRISARFWRTVADKLIFLNPRNEDGRERYVARFIVTGHGVCQCEMNLIKKHFELVSKDV